jgi:hypothetical protein
LQRDIPSLNEWIDSVEEQLDEYEATGGSNTNTNLDLQVTYLKVWFTIFVWHVVPLILCWCL